MFRADLQLEFMGVVSKDVMDSLYRAELGPYIKMRGYGSHAEAQRRQQRSQVLLLVEIDSEETKGIIPGKLFEYMAAKRPIYGAWSGKLGRLAKSLPKLKRELFSTTKRRPI